MALILGALGFQYIAHLAPCEMCHWQRWPHIAAAVIGLIGVTLWKKDARTLAVAAIILVAMSGLIGAYQWGMQAGLLPGPGACTVAHAYVMGSNAPPPEGTRFATTQRLADRYATAANWAIVEGLADFCAKRGQSLLELAFSWLLARPPVASVIAGATKPEQLEQNVKAADWALTPEDLAEIDRLTLTKG